MLHMTDQLIARHVKLLNASVRDEVRSVLISIFIPRVVHLKVARRPMKHVCRENPASGLSRCITFAGPDETFLAEQVIP
jgi:hypothetical protein